MTVPAISHYKRDLGSAIVEVTTSMILFAKTPNTKRGVTSKTDFRGGETRFKTFENVSKIVLQQLMIP